MDPKKADDAPVVVVVTRSGGIAGLRRTWRAEPVEPDDAVVFVQLIEQCPWDSCDESRDEDRGTTRGADRFQWSIEARCGDDDEHHARLGDTDLTGAWRDLVDAVRDWNSRDR